MKFRTLLNKYEHYNFIDYSSKILILGSCFAEHVFNYLKDRKYNSFINPCGISFNPKSISNSYDYLLGDKQINQDNVNSYRDRFFHFDFHGSFNDVSAKKCHDKIMNNLESGRDFRVADVVIISLGTSFVYELIAQKSIVNNCHKIPQKEFEKYLLTIEEVVGVMESLFKKILAQNSETKIILTVSPVRHLKDGMIENNWSKSTLLLSSKELADRFSQVIYFPSYELIIDDLRDYRFYGKDRIHPNEDAVEYVMEFFENHFMDFHEKEVREKVLNIRKRLNHKAFSPHSKEHQDFLVKLKEDMIKMGKEMNLDFRKEIESLHNRII